MKTLNSKIGVLAGRLDVETTAMLLGFQPHDIPALIRARLLKPLGRPSANAPKYFARVTVEQLAEDVAWLDKATMAMASHWRKKRTSRSTCGQEGELATHSSKHPSANSSVLVRKKSVGGAMQEELANAEETR